jgi:secondary thiamine-phosphate synthase enzyme
MSYQYQVRLRAKRRGFHLITDELIKACPDLSAVNCGLFNAFIQHSSASLTINENADPTVREDFEAHTNVMVPENAPYYKHTYEGPDDMPAHIKASLYGSSVSVPINQGRLLLGTWQGIYLGEHRDHAGGRSIIITLL